MGDIVEVAAGVHLQGGGDATSGEERQNAAGIVLHGGHAGVFGVFLPVAQGEKDPLHAGGGGEGFQIVRKAVEPEGAGEGGDTVKGIGAGGGPEGKKAPEGVACKDPVGGGRPQSGFYPGEDAAGEGIQKGLGFSAEIGAPLEGPWGWPWG